MTEAVALSNRLREMGFCSWYAEVAADAYRTDPWSAFATVSKQTPSAPTSLRTILDLLVLGHSVALSKIEMVLGEAVTAWMQREGLLRQCANGLCRSNFCLTVAFDEVLFTDWPVETPSQRLTSQRTYLSTTSFDCVRFVCESKRVRRALDLGCGTGLVAIKLAHVSDQIVAVDIDKHACWLTRLNCALAAANVTIAERDWRCLPCNGDFDLIVANPPWRIVPPSIVYPDPLARVGAGADGLGHVLDVLRIMPGLLSKGGKAAIRFDLPVDMFGECTFDFRPSAVLGEKFEYWMEELKIISVDDQARISADTCASQNAEIKDLQRLFLDHYKSLGIHFLRQVMCVVRRIG